MLKSHELHLQEYRFAYGSHLTRFLHTTFHKKEKRHDNQLRHHKFSLEDMKQFSPEDILSVYEHHANSFTDVEILS